jgi:lipopolysaccharide export system protein LptA
MKTRSCSPKCRRIAVCLALAAGLFCHLISRIPVWAADLQQQQPSSPIEITADMMVTDSKAHAAIFSGNVSATQAATRLTADKLTIFYKQSTAGSESMSSSDIERLEALGHVRILFDNKLAVSNQAVYIIEERKLILEGPESKVVSGQDEITGSKITFYRDDGRMTLESDDRSRVKAVIRSDQRGLN